MFPIEYPYSPASESLCENIRRTIVAEPRPLGSGFNVPKSISVQPRQ